MVKGNGGSHDDDDGIPYNVGWKYLWAVAGLTAIELEGGT